MLSITPSFPSLPFSSITDRLKSNCMSVTFLCVPSVLGCFKSSMFWGVTTALSLSDSWFSSLMASLMSVIVCLMNSFSSIIYRANPSQQCADRKITNLNTVVYVLYCCKGAIMLFLFGTAKISILSRPGKKRAGCPTRPAPMVAPGGRERLVFKPGDMYPEPPKCCRRHAVCGQTNLPTRLSVAASLPE